MRTRVWNDGRFTAESSLKVVSRGFNLKATGGDFER